ncbi:MAG: GNAT family N-acetyltransferase [Candidatus Eremiobacteraeota bacterium]|nr:GNAT family N-acetyltransferase [Candidatus Eremiobacteraeota bacterium]
MTKAKAAFATLRTTRLTLEPLRTRHARELFEPLRDERLYRYYAGAAPVSVEELAVRFATLESARSPKRDERWFNWVVRLHDGTPVGRMQATLRSDHALIGYDIFVPFWRNGYAREAAQAMLDYLARSWRVSLVRAMVDVENVASVRLLESLGFERTWTGASDDLPGRTDHVYEKRLAGP